MQVIYAGFVYAGSIWRRNVNELCAEHMNFAVVILIEGRHDEIRDGQFLQQGRFFLRRFLGRCRHARQGNNDLLFFISVIPEVDNDFGD
jgi:hypothetical protein